MGYKSQSEQHSTPWLSIILPTQLDSDTCACTQQGCSLDNPSLHSWESFPVCTGILLPSGTSPAQPSICVPPCLCWNSTWSIRLQVCIGRIPWYENWAHDSYWKGGAVTFQTRCTTGRMLSRAFILDTQVSSLTLVECRLLLCFHLIHLLSATPPPCTETSISPQLTSKNEQGCSACS